jgi:thymidylate kinase
MTHNHSNFTVVTDLNPQSYEGMAVTVRSLLAGATAVGLQVRLLCPPDGAGDAVRRTYVASAAWKLRGADQNSTVVYVPRGGLTRASVAKGALLAGVASSRVAQLILQSDLGGVRRVSTRVTYLVLSDALAEFIGDLGGSVVKVRLGVDAAQFAAGGSVDTSMWPRDGRGRVLHVGHLKRARNVGALAELSRRGFSCLLVASPSTEPDEALARELEDAGVAVVRRHIENLPAVYRGADVYLFPVSDPRACTTMPLSVLEALSCGTQVVATPFGAIRELLADVQGVHLETAERLSAGVEQAVKSPAVVEAGLVSSWETTAREIVHAVSGARSTRLVLLLGLDGTGKSTQSRLLLEEARRRGLRAQSVWARWDPLLLSPLLRFRRFGTGKSGDVGGQRYASWKRSVFRSRFARAAWRRVAAADHFLRVGPKLIQALRTNDFVVCDRYYHDALIDMAVSFGRLPPPVGLHRLFPEPNITVLLDADEETLARRKEDVPSLEYLRTRRPLYLEMAGRNGWPVLDATRSIADVREALNARIWPEQ